MRKRMTQAKIDKAVKAVASACGAAQVVIQPDGTIHILPVDKTKLPVIDRPKPARL